MRALTIATVVLWTGIAQGTIIGYRTDFPGHEVIYGCPVTFYVRDLPATPNGLKWEIRSKGDCVTNYIPLPGDTQAWTRRTRMTIPGAFEVRCTITYYPDRATGKTPPAEYPSIDISVPPPDGVTFSPKSASAPIGTDIKVIFALTCKKRPVCSAFGLPQELLLNIKNKTGHKLPYPDTWIPAVPNPRFHRSGTTIVDLKQAVPTRELFALPTGEFETGTQQLRILIPDLCGRPIPYPLGTVQVQWIKDTQTTYYLVHK